MPEELLMGIFTNGLQEEVQAKFRMMEANNLVQAMTWAQKIEEENKVLN